MSFYASLSGLKNSQTSLGVLAHNIANAETNGFKKSRADFADIAAGGANSDPRKMVGIGATVESITQNFGLGPVEQTGSALDVAIAGDGFFTMQSADSGRTVYTRNGRFDIDQDGFIQDGSNNRLQVFPVDATGAPTSATPVDDHIPALNAAGAEFAGITIGETGLVSASYADGSVEPIGSIALASFIAPTGLRQVGSSNWTSTGISGPAQYDSPGQGQYGSLMSGAIERSNAFQSGEIGPDIITQIFPGTGVEAAKATLTETANTDIRKRRYIGG